METLFSGLVPARMLNCWCDVASRGPRARLQVTEDCRGYKKGEEFEVPANQFVERAPMPCGGIFIRVRTIPMGDAMGLVCPDMSPVSRHRFIAQLAREKNLHNRHL